MIWLSWFRIQCCVLITSVSDQCKEDNYYVKTSVVDPGCFSRSRIRLFSILDPNFFHLRSRIHIKEFKYFNPKKWFLSSKNWFLSSRKELFILDPDPDFLAIPDPDPREKGTGYRIRIRNTGED